MKRWPRISRLIALVLTFAVVAPAFAVAGSCCAKKQTVHAMAGHKSCAHHNGGAALRDRACRLQQMPCAVAAKPHTDSFVRVAVSAPQAPVVAKRLLPSLVAVSVPERGFERISSPPLSLPLRI